jgi:hypothetical protein
MSDTWWNQLGREALTVEPLGVTTGPPQGKELAHPML